MERNLYAGKGKMVGDVFVPFNYSNKGSEPLSRMQRFFASKFWDDFSGRSARRMAESLARSDFIFKNRAALARVFPEEKWIGDINYARFAHDSEGRVIRLAVIEKDVMIAFNNPIENPKPVIAERMQFMEETLGKMYDLALKSGHDPKLLLDATLQDMENMKQAGQEGHVIDNAAIKPAPCSKEEFVENARILAEFSRYDLELTVSKEPIVVFRASFQE